MCSLKTRDIHGVLLLDKPTGISSNTALQIVKKIFFAKKAGYIGTLDPISTGMLPICFGESTKFSQYLINSDKRYQVIAKLGQNTLTSDSYGKIIQKRKINFTSNKLNKALISYLGETNQIPSMYSAIKYKGKPLYTYARKGMDVPRFSRKIFIYELNIISKKKEFIELEIKCSKGTYIRTLIDDLGEKLNCGAHVVSLRRLQVASYPISNLITLDQLYLLKQKCKSHSVFLNKLNNLLMPMDTPVIFYPVVHVIDFEIDILNKGQIIKRKFSQASDSIVRIMSYYKIFIGMGRVNKAGYLIPLRLVSKCNN